jgi:hypothetical protein
MTLPQSFLTHRYTGALFKDNIFMIDFLQEVRLQHLSLICSHGNRRKLQIYICTYNMRNLNISAQENKM